MKTRRVPPQRTRRRISLFYILFFRVKLIDSCDGVHVAEQRFNSWLIAVFEENEPVANHDLRPSRAGRAVACTRRVGRTNPEADVATRGAGCSGVWCPPENSVGVATSASWAPRSLDPYPSRAPVRGVALHATYPLPRVQGGSAGPGRTWWAPRADCRGVLPRGRERGFGPHGKRRVL